MKNQKRKRILVMLITVCFALLAAGCMSVPDTTGFIDVTKKSQVFDETVDAFFKAVDERDKEAVWNMFAPYARKDADMDLEEEIDRLFAFYPGPTQSCERDGRMAASTYSRDHGTRSATCSGWFAVICNDTTYYCDLMIVYKNDEDENEVGIHDLSLVSEKAICSEGFKFSAEPGLHIVEDAPGDYETARIGGYPNVFVPMDRRLTEQEILEFLKKDTSFKKFRETFGEPNAETSRYIRYAYELEEVDGEKRYAILAVNNYEEGGKAAETYEKGTIKAVSVENDVNKSWLYVLWEREETTNAND